MVKNAKAENDIKFSVPVQRDIANVVFNKINCSQTQDITGEYRLLNIGASPFNTKNMCATQAELDRKRALKAGKVKHASPFNRPRQGTGDDLQSGGNARMGSGPFFWSGVNPVAEMNVVCGPGAVLVDDFLPFCADTGYFTC